MTHTELDPITALAAAVLRHLPAAAEDAVTRFTNGEVLLRLPTPQAEELARLLGLNGQLPLGLALVQASMRNLGASSVGGRDAVYLDDANALRLAEWMSGA